MSHRMPLLTLLVDGVLLSVLGRLADNEFVVDTDEEDEIEDDDEQ